MLLVLDQFEQWLHARRGERSTELVQALRQCDGGRVQCLVLVRDDFWLAVTRFMRALEVRVAEGENSALVDLFDPLHARKVLAEFGRAFGRLPDNLGQLTPEQDDFLGRAVAGLTQEGRVVCVRLALFAEMVKGRPWSPATLRELGGPEGVGVRFLETTFSPPTAPPQHRLHRQAAQAVLKALLPEAGSPIKGAMRSRQDLLHASGYDNRPEDFEDLLRLLDTELRLITPTEPEEKDEGGRMKEESSADSSGRFYQLTHDYLVHSLREWLTARQRETLRGRAELRLAEQAALWGARPQTRYLPPLGEWLAALLWTRRRDWTEPQRQMMRAATRYQSLRAAAVLAVLAVIGLGLGLVRSQILEERDRELAGSAVHRLLDAATAEVPRILPEVDRYRRFTQPLLYAVVRDPNRSAKDRLHAALALLPGDADQVAFLTAALKRAAPDQAEVIAASLQPSGDQLVEPLWAELTHGPATPGERLSIACLLAVVDPDDPRWATVAARIAADLVAENPLRAAQWMQALRPARRWLLEPLEVVFRDPTATVTVRSVATSVLADYAADDTEKAVELIVDADPGAFPLLVPLRQRETGRAAKLLARELDRQPRAAWADKPVPPAWGCLSAAAQTALEAADGLLAERFAFCQTLPEADLDAVAADLARSGYRPSCFRPYASPAGVRVVAIWVRDGREWEWVRGVSPQEVREKDAICREKALWPADLACYPAGATAADPTWTFAALWVAAGDELTDARLYVDVPEDQHQEHWKPLNDAEFVPRTNLLRYGPNQEKRNSSVRWRFRRAAPEYQDAWEAEGEDANRAPAPGWCQADARWVLSPGGAGARAASVWWNGQNGFVSRQLHSLSPEEHLKKCREAAEEGFRPFSVAAVWVKARGGYRIASVWHRPVSGADAEETLARRQAAAAIALLQLGQPEHAWPLLRLSPDPRRRTWLVHNLAPAQTDSDTLLARLGVEPDASARRALLLALAGYAETAGADRAEAIARDAARLYRGDPDAGVHSAARSVLERFGRRETLRNLDEAPEAGAPPKGRGWYRNRQGQTFVVVPGPVHFLMGSPGAEPDHRRHAELLHPVRIGRRYAISTTEVTVEQFRRFKANHTSPHEYTPDPTCPVVMVTWYEAAQYCRWLSDQEKLPEGEMCYPPVSVIDPEKKLTIPRDFLRRKGYRLPTEAEWEYACRATTVTGRYYGYANSLLPFFAWTSNGSGFRSSPVGRLRPNDFGLFDALGNAMEWCHERDRPYSPTAGRHREDEVEAETVDNGSKRIRRGGSFLHQPSDARPAQRDPAYPYVRYPFQGFRVVRTLSSE